MGKFEDAFKKAMKKVAAKPDIELTQESVIKQVDAKPQPQKKPMSDMERMLQGLQDD